MSEFKKLQELVRKVRIEHVLDSEALSFVWICLESFLNLTKKEIQDSLTHGSLNGGIDALHIDNEGVHIVVCDYSNTLFRSKRPIPKKRIERFIETWLEIASGQDEKLKLNDTLKLKIGELKSYWQRCDSGYIPHTFYFFTNREYCGIPRDSTEFRLNYYMMHTYHYFDQEKLAEKLLTSSEK